jgi:hypothetical protein
MATGDISYADYTDAQNQSPLVVQCNAATTLAQNAYDVLAARRVGLRVEIKMELSILLVRGISISRSSGEAAKEICYSGGEVDKISCSTSNDWFIIH